MKARHKRLALVGGGMALLALASALVIGAFRQNLVFFYSPSEVAQGQAPRSATFRVGGMVEAGSVQRQADENAMTVRFIVTDFNRRIPVVYSGILPDLFREGKGVVAQGRLRADGSFMAQQVLAKHDENYMPPEAADALARGQPAARMQDAR